MLLIPTSGLRLIRTLAPCLSECSSCYMHINTAILKTKRHTLVCVGRTKSFAQSMVNASPSRAQPYLKLLRIDKPIGTWLLYWPCTWSIALTTPPGCLPDLWLLALFGCGAFLMRGSGCVINDLVDRDIDRKVERTRLRPIASGEVTPFRGLCLLGCTLSASLAILLQLNYYSVIVGMSSMLLVVAYPFAKRFTQWPQVVLGLTFNWGSLLGWSAVMGHLSPGAFCLYLSGLFWTLVYDTIYAHQDKEDDLLAGVKSTALLFGDRTQPYLTAFAAAMTTGLVGTGVVCDQTWPYYLGVGLTSAHLAWQIWSVKLDQPGDCWNKFRSNQYLGLLLFVSIVIGNCIKEPQPGKEDAAD